MTLDIAAIKARADKATAGNRPSIIARLFVQIATRQNQHRMTRRSRPRSSAYGISIWELSGQRGGCNHADFLSVVKDSACNARLVCYIV